MEKTCRTCVHRKNYECTCEKLRGSVFPLLDLDGFIGAIEYLIKEKIYNFLTQHTGLADEDVQRVLNHIEEECVGDEIMDMIAVAQNENPIEINLDNDFVCKYWR